MRPGSLGGAFVVTLAIAATPLACGEDETSPGVNSGSSGAGPSPTGGSGAAGGRASGGLGGEADGGSATSGGTNGTSGTDGTGATAGRAGTGGRPTGGASGSAGTGGRPTGGASGSGGDGGGSGAPDGGVSGGGMSGGPGSGEGGEGGEPWIDEATERLKRICEKTLALNCDDYSNCIEIFRWAFFGHPACGPVAEPALICLDTKATIEDFGCLYGEPFIVDRFGGPCELEFAAVSAAYCYGRVIEPLDQPSDAWVNHRSR